MQALIIKSDNPCDLKKIQAFAEQLGAECRHYTEDEIEDWVMAKLLREADRSKFADREEIMRLLDAE